MSIVKLNKSDGQTLIETLITLLFIVITVVALVKFQNYLSYEASLMQQRSYATLLATSRIESLRDFHVLKVTSGYTDYPSISSSSSSTTGANATYTTTWTVTANTDPTYKVIDVTVSWTDIYGNSQSVRLISDVAGIDPENSSAII